MRPILSLAAWNWRMARRPYGILCAVFAVQQLIVLLYQAQVPNQIGDGLAAYYSQGLQINVFGITFLLAGLLAGPAINDQKRAKCSYTWLTMPLSPAARLAAQVLTAAVLQLGFVALQLVLYAVYSVPVHLFENFVLAQQGQPYSVQLLFYEEVIRSGGIYWMIPRRPEQAALMAFTLLAAALLLTAVRLHKGWRRAVAVVIGLVCAWDCAHLLGSEANFARWGYGFLSAPRSAVILAVLLVFSVWWALRAIRRAETA